MQDYTDTLAELGNEPPMIADGRSGPPDRREISARWLSGTFLTGVTSSVLMGVALFAALDGRQQLATPPEIADMSSVSGTDEVGESAKTGRVIPPRLIARAKDKRRFELSTVNRVGDRDVVRTMPFLQINMALAASYKSTRSYPAFDPLAVFAEDGEAAEAQPSVSTGLFYDAKVESEMSLKTIDFPLEAGAFDESSRLSAAEVEDVVRNTAAILADGAVQVAALHYVDPQRFGDTLATEAFGNAFVRIVQENVSVAARHTEDSTEAVYAEEVIPFAVDRDIAEALAESGYAGEDATGMAEALANQLHGPALKAGSVLSLGLEVRGDVARIVRANVYARTTHVLTIAMSDRGQYVIGSEPDFNPAIATAFDETAPVMARNLPTIYDGIYRAAYSYGMSRPMTQQLIRLLAAEVDFQARASATDRVEVFFSQPSEDDLMSEDSELLYVSANFGGNTRTFYRFRTEDGTTDYFDAEGKSARQFLLRNPVPNGRFRSGFGARRHPILGYTRMHTGVDWAAPSGTPIIASGNGVVEKAGWASGYGKQTILRHTNGYETSYNHQSAIAKGVVPGAKVRQGQVIGYVGSTGLSTGPHLHYELIVNDRKVDPMRVRLPGGKALAGADLQAFQEERERIDNLLKQEDDVLNVASARVGG